MYDEKVTLTHEWEPKVFWDNAVKSELFHRGTRAAPLLEAGATSDITELFSLSRQKQVRVTMSEHRMSCVWNRAEHSESESCLPTHHLRLYDKKARHDLDILPIHHVLHPFVLC